MALLLGLLAEGVSGDKLFLASHLGRELAAQAGVPDDAWDEMLRNVQALQDARRARHPLVEFFHPSH